MNSSFKKIIVAGTLSLLLVGLFVAHHVLANDDIVVDGVTYQTVHEGAEASVPSERGTVKGREIAKIGTIAKVQRSNYWIQVTDMKAIQNGVQIFAKVWNNNDQQVGFGKDGTVDIERFIIINPPVLVPDPNGTVIREHIDRDTQEVVQVKYREDLTEAVLQVLEHTITVKSEKYGPGNIIPGKVGNTTTTVYPDPHTESTSVDGLIEYDNGSGGGESWVTVHDATAGSGASDTTPANLCAYAREYSSGSTYALARALFLFDTSSIPDNDSVSSATMSLYVSSVNDGDNDGLDYVNIYTTTPASNTALVTGDYDQFGTTAQATAIDIGNITTSAYNDWILNSTGLTNISKTGITKFGTREGHDAENSAISVDLRNDISCNYADTAGTTSDPKLVVEHSNSPPILSALDSSSITSNSAIITWTTDVSSDSEVHYDTSSPVTGNDPSFYNASMTTGHSMSLTGLSANTTYYYFASSTNDGGVVGTSTEASFTTLPFDIFNPHATNVGAGWADIKWTTSTGSNSKVWYSLTSPVSAANFTEVASSTASTTAHSLFVSGLLHNAVYYFTVTSTNGTGGTSTSTEKQFNTTSDALCTE